MTRETIYRQDPAFLAWAEAKIFTGGGRFRSDARWLTQVSDGEVLAVTVFDNWSRCDCNMHVASNGSRRWLNRDFLVRCFAFPFIQGGLRRVTGLVPASNADALRFDRHLGFQQEGLCRHALPNDDIVVLGMLREDCRYLPKDATYG